MNYDKIPDLIYSFPESYPENIVYDEVLKISTPELNLIKLKKETSIFAAFEWIIPTAFGVFILKPYFESFLSEAGKDHYTLLKDFIKKFIKKGKIFEYKLITAKETQEKLSKKYNQSVSISLEFQTKNGINIKVLFDNDLTIEDWENATDEILQILEQNFNEYPNDLLTSKLILLENIKYNRAYIIINKENKILEFHDEKSMMKKYK